MIFLPFMIVLGAYIKNSKSFPPGVQNTGFVVCMGICAIYIVIRCLLPVMFS